MNNNSNPKHTLPLGWNWAKLGEVCSVFAGSAAPQGQEYFSDQGVPFVRVSDLAKFKRTINLTLTNECLSQKAINELPLIKASIGTVLFPKSGAAITTNNRAILGIDAYIVSHLMACKPNSEILSFWLYWALSQINMMSYSDNDAYPSLKQSVVEKIEIPLPPLEEQKRIVAILKEQLSAVEKAKTAAEVQLFEINSLPSVILRKAFNGEI